MKASCVSCEKVRKFLNTLTERHDSNGLGTIPIFTRNYWINNEKSLNAAEEWTEIQVEVPSDRYKSDGSLLH
jgi:hypothetical protein